MHRTIDRRSELVFELREVDSRAGEMKQVNREVPAPEGIGSDVIGVPAGSAINLELRFESVGDGILVTGIAEVQLAGECGRCLTPIASEEVIDVQELFLFPGKDPDDEEASRVQDECIDLEPLIRDAVVLDLPFIPLCREDCAGLCPTCGADLNAEPEHQHDDEIDPRWAGLVGWTTPSNDTQAARPMTEEI